MHYLISIIIPVYNTIDTLESCLNSIIRQAGADIQVIVVDDGSTDGSLQRALHLSAQHPSMEIYHKDNGGLSDARNYGILKATGQYLMFVDSDDTLDDHTLDSLRSVIMAHPEYDILEFGIKGKREITFAEHTYHDARRYWLEEKGYEHSYAWNKIYRRHLFTDISFPKGVVFEDVATIPSLLQKANVIATTPAGFYHYHFNPEGITEKAGGKEWRMLLSHHIKTLEWAFNNSDLAMQYYMRAVDCQITTSQLTGDRPTLPSHPIRLGPLSLKHKIKALAIKVVGLAALCRIYRLLSKQP